VKTPTGKVPALARHESRDWCHVCGHRRERLVDCWRAENAEHERLTRGTGGAVVYTRICDVCLADMLALVL